jgi:hypothetical protein
VFLNELAPRPGGYRDASGQPEPWLELYNSGSSTVVLDGWMLSASSTTTPWTFPAGLFLRAGERRVIVLDGESGQSTPAEWHASFRPDEENGWIALVRPSPVDPDHGFHPLWRHASSLVLVERAGGSAVGSDVGRRHARPG